MKELRHLASFLVVMSLALAARAAEPVAEAAAEPATPATTPALPGVASPLPGVLSMGQPTKEQLEQAAKSGVRTVINLRTDGEPGFEWEAALAGRLGLSYVRIPIAGEGDLTRANVERLDAALRAGLDSGGVLLHCASGNRNGALLALREAWLNGAEPEAALALGRAAGLTRLEPATRTLLRLPPAQPTPE